MWEKLLYFDRRIIFALIALVVMIPFLTEWRVSHGQITPSTQNLYNEIESLEPGTPVMLVFDYGPSGMPELHPMATALAHHILSRDLRLLGVAIEITGPSMCQDAVEPVAEELGKVEGVDWVNLGWKPGRVVPITQMGENMKRTYPTDFQGRPTNELEVMAGIRDYQDIGLIIDLASGAAPGLWIAYAHDPYQVKLATGVTGVMAIDYYVYLQTGQLCGLLNGLKGTAEYEHLIGKKGFGFLGMSSQSVAHLVIILFVIIGNIGYFTVRRRRQGSE